MIVAKAGNPGTQRTKSFFKNSPTKKTTPTRYFTKVEIICIFFFPGCSLARSLQYIPVKGLYKVCVGARPDIWALRNCILC